MFDNDDIKNKIMYNNENKIIYFNDYDIAEAELILCENVYIAAKALDMIEIKIKSSNMSNKLKTHGVLNVKNEINCRCLM
eukprot:Pgem_evm1s12426